MPRSLLWLLPCALILSLASWAAAAGDPADSHPGLNLIPWPKAIEVKQGQMKLTADSRIVAGDDSLKPLAVILSDDINVVTGLKLPVVTTAPQAGDIVLKINKSIKADEQILVARPPSLVRTTDGAHTIVIADQAVVEGFDYRAVAEGTSTILQAISQLPGQVTLPRLTIKDWPHADYCGIMIDIGRQNHSIEMLKKMVVASHMYKVRYMQLHMTDDQGWTFPSTKYPQLGSKNYCVGHAGPSGVAPKVFNLQELKDFVAFADARGIAIVPEFEVPGHSGAALRSLPEIFDAINPDTKQPVGMGCMNMASEEIYPALDTIIGEMCDVFKSTPYFHIGSDEVSMGRVALAPGYKAFMEKHGLKSDGELANYFIAAVNDMVKKHGKQTIKWEGLADAAAKDIIVMTWVSNSNEASRLISQGYTTITCPWNLGVPWEQWSMYVCNGSMLKKTDPVIGATSVAWEQSSEFHMAGVRSIALRQERTWGPDNTVTEQGFASRFQALDAAVGKLIDRTPKPRMDATFTATANTSDLLGPLFAFDGNEATFYKSATAARPGDNLTVNLAKPALVYAVEALTGINGKGLMDGAQLQVSADGNRFVTVARLDKGAAKAVLTNNTVKAVRLQCNTPQADPMIVREIKLQLMVEVSGNIGDTKTTLGEGNFAALKGDASIGWPTSGCLNPIINKGFTLAFLSGGGNAIGYDGPISGTGKVEVYMGGADGGFRNSPLTLAGTDPNTMTGTWFVKYGRLLLAKPAGVDAVGGTIVVGGNGDNDCLYWANSDQINDAAAVELLDSPKGGATLQLNGCNDKFASLKMAAHTKIVTDDQKLGGVLTVGALTLNGKSIPKGIYTSAEPWITGSGFVVVGDIKYVDAAGAIENANTTIGAGNIAVLTAATSFGPATGNCAIPVKTGDFGLTFSAAGDKPTQYSGFITGNGAVTFDAAATDQAARQPLEITGPSASSYKGATILSRGVLKLNKPAGVIAIPGNLTVGGATAANANDGVILAADGQIAPTATVTLNGKAQPCFLDLAGHKAALVKVVMDGAAKIRTAAGGQLTTRQIIVDGKRVAAGTYKAPQAWLEGAGSVTIDPQVNVGPKDATFMELESGNIANLTGNALLGYPIAVSDVDIVTNGHTMTFDSGDGNPLCYMGAISGTGDVVMLLGPSYGAKDVPLRLTGDKPNTSTGKFIARKGLVQLEKPDGVDAISGNVVVGGQGFNDGLYWINSNQIKDSATITMITAGNSGAAYLNLNGCSETVAALVMTAKNTVKTDSPDGKSGTLTVKALTVDNVKKPAGTYTAATEKWIDGKGKVVVAP